MDWLMDFMADAWVQKFIGSHTVLIGLLVAIGSMVSGGGVVGGILKILAILSPTTGDNKVKTMLENLRKPTAQVRRENDLKLNSPMGV